MVWIVSGATQSPNPVRSGMVPNLRMLIVDANEVRAAIIEEGLREAGYRELVRVSATTGLVAAIEQHDPDVVVIDLEDPSRDALADMFLVSRHLRRPIPVRRPVGLRYQADVY